MRYVLGMTDRERILCDLCMALRDVPASILRDVGKRQVPGAELAEKLVAEKILEHLELGRWRLVPPVTAKLCKSAKGAPSA